MAKTKEGTNPFYVLLLAAGVIFGVTACAYVVMTVQTMQPGLAPESPLLGWLERHGTLTLVVQLIVLGLLTAAAIGTDGWWDVPAESDRPSAAEDASSQQKRES